MTAAQQLRRTLHTFKGSARMAGAMRLGELTHLMESRLLDGDGLAQGSPALFEALDTDLDHIACVLDALRTGEVNVPLPWLATPEAAAVEPPPRRRKRTRRRADAPPATSARDGGSAVGGRSERRPTPGRPTADVSRWRRRSTRRRGPDASPPAAPAAPCSVAAPAVAAPAERSPRRCRPRPWRPSPSRRSRKAKAARRRCCACAPT